jgi:hypothetical protein
MSNQIQDHILLFHEDCGGVVIGEINGNLKCAECGTAMDLAVLQRVNSHTAIDIKKWELHT